MPPAKVRHPPSSLAGAAELKRDQLTGLPNRAVLHQGLAAALARTREAGAEPRCGALLLINVNKFREVNEALGFDGDDAIVRWGGDQLALVLEQLERTDLADHRRAIWPNCRPIFSKWTAPS